MLVPLGSQMTWNITFLYSRDDLQHNCRGNQSRIDPCQAAGFVHVLLHWVFTTGQLLASFHRGRSQGSQKCYERG